MSDRDYASRGSMWLIWAVCSLIGAVLELFRGNYMNAAIAVCFFSGFMTRYLSARRKSKKEWEEKYGVYDERDVAIDGLATKVAMSVMVGGVVLLSRFVLTTTREQFIILGLDVVGVAAYLVAKAYYERRM